MKNITLLGSTGSIGRQTLDIAGAHKDAVRVLGLASGSNSLSELAAQCLEFQPYLVSVPNHSDASELRKILQNTSSKERFRGEITYGAEGLVEVATLDEAQTVVTGVVGFLGVKPTLEAIKLGKTIALANKETMVAAGPVIIEALKKHKAAIVPVDSEHSAIFQSLGGHKSTDIESIWLTGSGGPFRTWSKESIENATIDDALNHPNWSMGPKITIDSATMMNKGLEIIEARYLFDIEPKKIEVLIHPQSILHSAVQFIDGSVVGQMGVPDMRLPIHYAIFYPETVASTRTPRLNLMDLGSLSFQYPDFEKFPCLKLAREVAEQNNTLACVLNAANEIIVEAYLQGRLAFHKIASHIEKVLVLHKPVKDPCLDDILEADRWAREKAKATVATAEAELSIKRD
ncbi:MAG: 1-deoxy-D-xylulose-5-phosphate reductoisomerase [Candidatus Obscuribacterales bacterium]|nr:1-deoxy-D-xylulose-5-phosphate reductoisomerase [Candidatus Obscuribacterales bacterium]